MSITEPVSPTGYDRLARPVQKWVYQQGWKRLRDIQERAIQVILASGQANGRQTSSDVIIAAATASGKTEAAFLPLISRIISDKKRAKGFVAIYISPIKALINDQHGRLESLCQAVDMSVHKWHGDVAQSAKTRARKHPDGILLITPESLEALLMRRGNEVARLMDGLNAIVIDELHAFIGSERGVQLQSILHRLDIIGGRQIDRIGLSATLGDMQLAAEALRPGEGKSVKILESKESRFNLLAQIRAYVNAPQETGEDEQSGSGETTKKHRENSPKPKKYAGSAGCEIAEHIFSTMRGKPNLIFASSRAEVETLADKLRDTCERAGIANEFFAHHGNLSKEHREFVEGRLREDERPTTAIATSTLELGIDIGDIDTVGQLGAPHTVASLRQRVGRSGRREGSSAILRIYCEESSYEAGSPLPERLRLPLVHAIASLSLLVEGWCEPPLKRGLHYSTLLHQILATITQYGGLDAQRLYQLLNISGPFHSVGPEQFGQLLQAMGRQDTPLIEQSRDGTLMLARLGERLTSHFSIYAVFQTPEEYKVIANGKELGRLEVKAIPKTGDHLVFMGQRWTVSQIDEDNKSVHLTPSSTGNAKFIGGSGAELHDRIIKEMHRIFRASDLPSYLDDTAKELLVEARKNYAEVKLDHIPLQAEGDGVLLFPLVGTVRQKAFVLALQQQGLSSIAYSSPYFISLSKCKPEQVIAALQTIASSPAPDPLELAKLLPEHSLRREKYDRHIPVELLQQAYAFEAIDAALIPRLAQEFLKQIEISQQR